MRGDVWPHRLGWRVAVVADGLPAQAEEPHLYKAARIWSGPGLFYVNAALRA